MQRGPSQVRNLSLERHAAPGCQIYVPMVHTSIWAQTCSCHKPFARMHAPCVREDPPLVGPMCTRPFAIARRLVHCVCFRKSAAF